MSATDESAKIRPRCRAPLDPIAYAAGQPFSCGQCGAKVQRNPAADVHVHTAPVVAEGDDLLADVQALLVRMLVGIFQYIFIQLPADIWSIARRWFPTVVRLVVIFCLACLWLGATFGPLAYSLCREGRERAWIPKPLPAPEFYLEHATAFEYGIALWTILALYGSFWKALKGVRRFRSKRRAAGKR